MSYKSVIQSQLEDEEVFEELRQGDFISNEMMSSPEGMAESVGGMPRADDILEGMRAGRLDMDRPQFAEAIIVRHGFPSLLVKNGAFEQPKLRVWRDRLSPHSETINKAIESVGRIELQGHPRLNWCGTGFVVDEETIVTNRHVAKIFTDVQSRQLPIKKGLKVRIDFREEHLSPEELEYLVASVKFVDLVEPHVDMALLRLAPEAIRNIQVYPLPIAESLDDVEFLGVIGYPAFDTRNSALDQKTIFDDIYDVKRFAPGRIMSEAPRLKSFRHNCTTLGGNSGSAVIDIATGAAIGLHFGGREGDANFAVKPQWILDRCTSNGVNVRSVGEGARAGEVAETGIEGEAPAFKGPPATYRDRAGFDPQFLGTGTLSVPLPKLNAVQRRHAATVDGGGHQLRYEHFTVVMNRTRRLAYYTACNIDGSRLWAFRRGRDKWFLDSRLDEAAQIGNELYRGRHNDFDRGHLVRRLDPVWGDEATATRAMEDTFHYTNAAPQHRKLNRRIWLALEDHILGATDNKDLKISVIAGPVFGVSDPLHKPTQLPVPLAFWKVIASVKKRRRRKPVLQAQAFLLRQGHMIDDDDLEVIFGGPRFETAQITVQELERLSGLDFHNLRDADTFGRAPDVESIADFIEAGDDFQDPNYQTLVSLDDVVM